MAFFKHRRKTSRTRNHARVESDMHVLRVNVTSPRIVMFQLLGGLGRLAKLILILAVLALFAWGGYLLLQKFFLGNEKYTLEHVQVETNGHLEENAIRKALGLDGKPNIFSVSTGDAERTLIALPEVISAKVNYHLPNTLKVEITERVPVVWLECQSHDYPGRVQGGILADAEGTTFPCVPSFWQAYRDLPVVVIPEAGKDDFNHGQKMRHKDTLRAMSLLESFKSSAIRAQWLPERVVLLNDYSMEAICNDGTRAVFGMYEHKQQLENFISISEHAHKNGRNIEHVNLMPKKNIPVRYMGDPILIRPRTTHSAINPQPEINQ